MAFSHKNSIIAGTEALEKWAAENKAAFTENPEGQFQPVDWEAFREALNVLNPEIHECELDSCLVETWKGASDNCPACGTPGTAQGRMVYAYTPKNPRGSRSNDEAEETQQDDGPPSL